MKKQPILRLFSFIFPLLVLLLLILGMAEIFLRVVYSSIPEQILYSKSYESGKGVAGGPDYDFRLNSSGYKDTEFREKEQDGFRILALGDSFTFGNVPYSKSYIHLLEDNLRGISPELDIVNLGLPGVGLRTYLTILAREGLDLQPDMLLLSVFIGDDILQSEARKYYTYSYLLSWVNTFIKEGRHYEGRRYNPDDDYCDTCPTLMEEDFIKLQKERLFLYRRGDGQLTRRLEYSKFYLDKIFDICQRHNIEPVVVLIPTVLQSNFPRRDALLGALGKADVADSEWKWAQANEMLRDYLKEKGVPSIDLLDPFVKNSDGQLYRNGDIHWSLAGHALAARCVASALQIENVKSDDSSREITR